MTQAEEHSPSSIFGAAQRTADKLISTLPPAFLLLVLINVMFLALIMWFLNSQMMQRTQMMEKFADRCMEIALRATPSPK